MDSAPNTALYNIPFNIESFNGMPYRTLGKSGLSVSNVGLGTWKIGLPETGDGSRLDEKRAFQLFERAVELGVCFWDTANRYNNSSGNSERIIGRWLRQNPAQRRNLIIATKVSGGMDGLTPNHCGLSRGSILDAVYSSLARLQTSHIDLLYFHTYDPSAEIEESLVAIEDLIAKDMVRFFAVSNFTVENLKAYQSVQKNLSVRTRITAVQNQFDILDGEPVSHRGVMEYVFEAGISFIAWSPLAKGFLSEKYLDLPRVGAGHRLFDEGASTNIKPLSRKKIERLAVLSSKWDMTLSQLALSYMLTLPGMGPVIPSSATIAQLESNAAAAKIILSDQQKMQIENALRTDTANF